MRSALLIAMVALFAASNTRAADTSPTELQNPSSASPASTSIDAIVSVLDVRTRDALGRIARFADSRGREFELSYDSEGRVISAQATRGEHISQVKSVGYDSQGRFAGATIGLSYMVVANYLDDGTQVIRDRYGGLIARRGDLAGGYQVIQVSDPTGRLVSVVEGLDTLMRGALNKQ